VCHQHVIDQIEREGNRARHPDAAAAALCVAQLLCLSSACRTKLTLSTRAIVHVSYERAARTKGRGQVKDGDAKHVRKRALLLGQPLSYQGPHDLSL
jgi:hypothetical protein